jgi:hypothetical protein
MIKPMAQDRPRPSRRIRWSALALAPLIGLALAGCGAGSPAATGNAPAATTTAPATAQATTPPATTAPTEEAPPATAATEEATTEATADAAPAAATAEAAATGAALVGPSLEKPTGKLSARLQTLSDSAVATQDVNAQSEAVGLPASGSGSLMRNDQGEVLVVMRMSDVSDASQQAVQDNGATITNVETSLQIISAYVNPERLNDLADLDVVLNIREELSP